MHSLEIEDAVRVLLEGPAAAVAGMSHSRHVVAHPMRMTHRRRLVCDTETTHGPCSVAPKGPSGVGRRVPAKGGSGLTDIADLLGSTDALHPNVVALESSPLRYGFWCWLHSLRSQSVLKQSGPEVFSDIILGIASR